MNTIRFRTRSFEAVLRFSACQYVRQPDRLHIHLHRSAFNGWLRLVHGMAGKGSAYVRVVQEAGACRNGGGRDG